MPESESHITSVQGGQEPRVSVTWPRGPGHSLRASRRHFENLNVAMCIVVHYMYFGVIHPDKVSFDSHRESRSILRGFQQKRTPQPTLERETPVYRMQSGLDVMLQAVLIQLSSGEARDHRAV